MDEDELMLHLDMTVGSSNGNDVFDDDFEYDPDTFGECISADDYY